MYHRRMASCLPRRSFVSTCAFSASLAMIVCVMATTARALPSLPALVERHGPAVARVLDEAGAPLGQGFFVATDGTLISAWADARIGAPVVVDTAMAGRVSGVVRATAGGLVVVHVAFSPDDPPPVSLPIARADDRVPEWVVGVAIDDGGARTAALGGPRAGHRRPTYDLPCPPGAPIVTADGRVIGVVLEQRGRSRVVAAGPSEVRALLERVGPRAL